MSNYSLGDGGSGSFSVIVGVDEMSDLVCPTFSVGSGDGSGEVLGMQGDISPLGMSMVVVCFDDVFFNYFSGPSYGGSQPVTIIIGDETISTFGSFGGEASADIIITATSFF